MHQVHDAIWKPEAIDEEERPLSEQYGALPWRNDGGRGVRVLLVTSRTRGLWILPKGWPIDGLSPHRAAAQEALEEAGVFGTTSPEPCGSYRYTKILADESTRHCRVTIYPLRVKATLVDWQESGQRHRKWFSLSEAAAAVSEPDLAQLLSNLAGGWSENGISRH